MVIIKYLIRETLKSQLATLFILLLIFFCQNLVKILSAIVDGEIPTNLVFSLLCLGVPEMAQFILPLSLFFGLLVTFSKLYIENEITVMYACGLSKTALIKVAMILAVLTGTIATINVIWIKPWSSRYQDRVLAEAKTNLGMLTLIQRQFQYMNNDSLVLFIENIHGNHFCNVFLAYLRPKNSNNNTSPSIVVADSGHLTHRMDGSQAITLNKGTSFEGTAKLRNFRITDFQSYQVIISHQKMRLCSNDTEQMNMRTLWNINNSYTRAEFHWRLTLVFAVFIMALIVVPLSMVNLQNVGVFSILPTILLYLVFFLLQISIKYNGGKGKLEPIFWMWLINALYLLLAVLLNLWDTTYMRRIRANFICRGAI